MPPDPPTAPFSHRACSVKAEPRQRRGGRKRPALTLPPRGASSKPGRDEETVL